MNHILRLSRTHWAALALAVVSGVIVALPQLSFRMEYANHPVYQGIELLPDAPWSPRVREVMDGHESLGNIYYKDGKSDPYIFQPLGSIVVGYLGKALSLDINDTLLFSRLLFGFAVVLLVYVFVYLLCREKLLALAASAAVVLTDAVANPTAVLNMLHGEGPGHYLGLSYPVNSGMLHVPLFGFLILFWLFYTQRRWRYGIVSALLLGLQFYNYFYTWTYLYAFGGLLVLFYLFKRQWQEAVRLGSVFAGALIISIPYWINIYQASLYPSYAEVAMRFGMLKTHAPLFIGAVALVALIVFLLGFPRQPRERYLFGLALLLAPIVTLNQQILTGMEMQAAHYHWYFHKPIGILFAVLALLFLFSRLKLDRYKQAFIWLILAASVAVGAFTQIATYRSAYAYGEAESVKLQRFGPALVWLAAEAAPEEVVLATDVPSHLVTIYTPLNVFYHRAGYASLAATHERLLDQLFTFYRLRGVGTQEARGAFFADREWITNNLYGLYYRQATGADGAIPDEKLEEILQAYEATLSTPATAWLKDVLAEYEVEYVLWDKAADPEWRLDRFPFLHKAWTEGDFVVYRFVP